MCGRYTLDPEGLGEEVYTVLRSFQRVAPEEFSPGDQPALIQRERFFPEKKLRSIWRVQAEFRCALCFGASLLPEKGAGSSTPGQKRSGRNLCFPKVFTAAAVFCPQVGFTNGRKKAGIKCGILCLENSFIWRESTVLFRMVSAL